MAPLYSLISWLSYRFYTESTYYITIRDCYEAFVLASFFILLLRYLGDSPEEQRRQLLNTKKRSLMMPLCFLRYNPTKQHWLFWIKWGILQYVIVKPIVTVVAVVLQYHDVLCEESFSPAFGNFWIQVVNFISVSVAMYYLITFYVTIRELIKKEKPFLKFLAVKLVTCSNLGRRMERVGGHTRSLQTVAALVVTGNCYLFLLLASDSFKYTHIFGNNQRNSILPYRSPKPTSAWSAFWDSLNPIDFIREVVGLFKYAWNWMRGSSTTKGNRLLDLEFALGKKRVVAHAAEHDLPDKDDGKDDDNGGGQGGGIMMQSGLQSETYELSDRSLGERPSGTTEITQSVPPKSSKVRVTSATNLISSRPISTSSSTHSVSFWEKVFPKRSSQDAPNYPTDASLEMGETNASRITARRDESEESNELLESAAFKTAVAKLSQLEKVEINAGQEPKGVTRDMYERPLNTDRGLNRIGDDKSFDANNVIVGNSLNPPTLPTSIPTSSFSSPASSSSLSQSKHVHNNPVSSQGFGNMTPVGVNQNIDVNSRIGNGYGYGYTGEHGSTYVNGYNGSLVSNYDYHVDPSRGVNSMGLSASSHPPPTSQLSPAPEQSVSYNLSQNVTTVRSNETGMSRDYTINSSSFGNSRAASSDTDDTEYFHSAISSQSPNISMKSQNKDTFGIHNKDTGGRDIRVEYITYG
ncbi:6015_t:CDS:2 [Paraglomus occultum]|uniref:6015_t:CDS:1 n=1 Tax=Paraglomus occultum TaxID=144539 RepID=A0A9N8Z567_9GLOM|nr:6015_t:CDS:2 [Paraglomus occultum]